MHMLVTGATGFIGRHLVRELLAQGHDVRVLVRAETVSGDDTKKRLVAQWSDVDVLQGGLDNSKALSNAARNIDVIFHLAGIVPVVGTETWELLQANVAGTRNVVDAACAAGVRRVVFTSSVAVYGFANWSLTEDALLRGRGRYALSKRVAERLLDAAQDEGLTVSILRLSHVYGAEAVWCEQFVQRALLAPFRPVGHQGRRAMQWIHVSDVVRGLVCAGRADKAAGEVFNLAGAEAWTYAQTVLMTRALASGRNAVASMSTSSIPLKYSIAKSERLLRFTPEVGLATGLKQVVEHNQNDRSSTSQSIERWNEDPRA